MEKTYFNYRITVLVETERGQCRKPFYVVADKPSRAIEIFKSTYDLPIVGLQRQGAI